MMLKLHSLGLKIYRRSCEINVPALAGWNTHRALLLGLFLQISVCGAQNLAQNPGFENGNTVGWSSFGSSTISAQNAQTHSGNYAALVQNRTATWNGIAQSLVGVVQSGQSYNLSVWVRLVGVSNQTIQITVQKVDGSGTSYSPIASGSVSSNQWTQLAGQYAPSVSGTLTGLTFYAEVPTSATAEFQIDDLIIESATPPDATNGTCTINWSQVYQRIDGFGASSAWRSSWNSTVANQYFSTNTGIGLSLLRTRIAPGGTTVENSIMQLARDRGARVWSAPWSPPATFKSNTNVNGGSFVGNPVNYQAYANQLAGYVVKMKSQYGIDLYALSVQNEPDADVTTYESCNWTAQQIHDFVPYLSSALVASNASSTKIMLPESQNWTDPQGLRLTAMNDPAVASLVGIIANHNYVPDNDNGDQATPAALNAYGKALWETEVSTFSAFDGSITNGIYWARRIHSFLTVAQLNAWHYWWLSSLNNDNSGLANPSDLLAKRAYVVGQYSRFVRPDFYRIGVITNLGLAMVSAYKDPGSSRFAIVAINSGGVPINQSFNLTNFGTVANVTPWITSATLSLASQASVTITNSAFTYQLPALSVVTFVGQALSNTPPVLASVSNLTITAGANVTITNVASDLDVPAQTLTFSLLAGPTNSVFNSSNGIFAWRPFMVQADTTNLVTVKVTDNGAPNLSATSSFTLKVPPMNQPAIASMDLPGGQVSLIASGALGPDYTLLTSTNLVNWQTLFTTNPASMPFNLIDTNDIDAARFYRLQLGP
jgi:glucuronoarabinoxylan endo-1,4-beta-xylanase